MEGIGEGGLPEYAHAVAILQRCASSPSPAEAHGFALGLVAAEENEPLATWQQELYRDLDPNDVLAADCRALLDRMIAGVLQRRGRQELQLELYLPRGIAVDRDRLSAVRDWVQGFLFGLGLAGEGLQRQLSAQTRELLADLAEFTRLETEGADDTTENQAALIEIEEYLREGVLLIEAELSERAGDRRPGDQHDAQ